MIRHTAAYARFKQQVAEAADLTTGGGAAGLRGRFLVLGVFSYFEAYVMDMINEVVAFHGGEQAFLATAHRRATRFVVALPPDLLKHKRKLQEPPKKGKDLKYAKHSKVLAAAGFRFPSELLSPYGVRLLAAKARKLRAADIPDVLQHGLHCPLKQAEFSRIGQIQSLRNQIAHGRAATVTLSQAEAARRDLARFAVVIDSHATEHLLVVERHA